MNKFKTYSFVAIIAGFVACGSLMADTCTAPSANIYTVPDLPDTDTLCVALIPSSGTLNATAGSTVGWGFTVSWTSTDDDWLLFTGSTVVTPSDPELDPNLLQQYTDFIGAQGGPTDGVTYLGLEGNGTTPVTWSETFNATTQQGVGSYQVVSNAPLGAYDEGEITLSFEVFDGNPLGSGEQIGQPLDYTYAEASTGYEVNVVAPEPNTSLLFAGALLLIAVFVGRKRSKSIAIS